MKKKLACVLYNMNYNMNYSCTDQLVESPALTLIVGVAKRAQFPARALSMHYSHPIIRVHFSGLHSWYTKLHVKEAISV